MENARAYGRIIDLEMLDEWRPRRFLHRLVDEIVGARGNRERFFYLRSGDEVAVRAADDGSFEILDEVTIVAELPDGHSMSDDPSELPEVPPIYPVA